MGYANIVKCWDSYEANSDGRIKMPAEWILPIVVADGKRNAIKIIFIYFADNIPPMHNNDMMNYVMDAIINIDYGYVYIRLLKLQNLASIR